MITTRLPHLVALIGIGLLLAAHAWAQDTPKGPPLPFHTIEGYGGGAITPIAYLVNPGPAGKPFGKPAIAISEVSLGKKNLTAITVTETLFGRIELGYGADRLGLGSLPMAIRTATVSTANPSGIDIGHSDDWLQNFNIRALLVKENSEPFGLPTITAGVHFKKNQTIGDIDQKLGKALTNIGLTSTSGIDYTLTASKMYPKVAGRPFIATAGMRLSKAANLGFLGFGDTYKATLEGNVVYLPTNKLLVAAEYRQKSSPIGQIPGLVGDEDDWLAFDASYIASNYTTVVLGYGKFGTLANTTANSAFWLQLKDEF